ncbi:hypothetical protein X963_6176 [Burkholderia pseudomallei MSHR7498]|uniref:hypothetical protein n=1 Tax=Burkholderia pseudomallei TaxID=28450 RepID=UPI0002EE2290|nr:hypothetical protein [Burkholderia pseudomallei]AIV70764.1 hypothetical protein Y028_2638 [Burkholderia pseudomallei MSHR62]KGS08539.1 hypothetical protein X948_6126 [Burkholderia pseudomallei MSHR5608]KGS96600.1 hypothetical protein X963_6176 [Burkholderia pseudomallei MSHR7498]KGW15102.1 hypothetical protein X980_1340 [Burkholderia pseudomallei MSHR4000]KGX34110.1 hypothetical protein Y598_3833 [Burkholderia pseudomallei MSHR3335]KGX67663.1 hypothetical protein Y026_5476 [Burkholderia ps
MIRISNTSPYSDRETFTWAAIDEGNPFRSEDAACSLDAPNRSPAGSTLRIDPEGESEWLGPFAAARYTWFRG